MSCDVKSCDVMSCHAMSCHVMRCRVVSCPVVPCRCRAVPCRAVSCRAVPCRIVSCRVVPCRVVYVWVVKKNRNTNDGFGYCFFTINGIYNDIQSIYIYICVCMGGTWYKPAIPNCRLIVFLVNHHIRKHKPQGSWVFASKDCSWCRGAVGPFNCGASVCLPSGKLT